MKLVLTIDQGTTGTKATLWAPTGRPVAQGVQEFPQHFPKPGWVEHRAEEILKSVKKAVAQALKNRSARSIACIGITNQRETLFAWNRRTGKPLAPGIVWQCRRTAERCEKLKKRKGEAIRKKTGLLVDAYFSASKMEWLLNHVPAVARAAQAKQLAFGTVDSLLLWHLTSGKVHASEPSNASRTMLYNIYTKRYDPQLLRLFHIPKEALPSLLPSAGLFGTTQGLPYLPDGIPITGILGDQQAALFGQGCFDPGLAKNTYGTGAFVLLNTGSKPFPSKRGLITTVAWDLPTGTTYALEGSIFICGAAIQWLRDGLGIIKSAKESEKLARAVPHSGGVQFVPALVGLGAPHWNPYARGTITGITRGTRREHLVRATLEAMALQVADALEIMEKETGIKLRELRVDGGASDNLFLLELQSQCIQRPVVRGIQESTSFGAFLVAGLGAGLFPSLRELRKKIKTTRTFTPTNKKEARALKKNWKKALSAVLQLSTREP